MFSGRLSFIAEKYAALGPTAIAATVGVVGVVSLGGQLWSLWEQQSMQSSAKTPGLTAIVPSQHSSAVYDQNRIIAAQLFGSDTQQVINRHIPETTLNMQLTGVIFSNSVSTAAAIIKVRGRGKLYRVGDAMGQGATLKEVFPSYVTIERHGVLEKLNYKGVSEDSDRFFTIISDGVNDQRPVQGSDTELQTVSY